MKSHSSKDQVTIRKLKRVGASGMKAIRRVYPNNPTVLTLMDPYSYFHLYSWKMKMISITSPITLVAMM